MDDLKDIFHELKNALNGLMLADENILALTPMSGPDEIRQAMQLSREAWRELEAEQKRFIRACAEQARRDR